MTEGQLLDAILRETRERRKASLLRLVSVELRETEMSFIWLAGPVRTEIQISDREREMQGNTSFNVAKHLVEHAEFQVREFQKRITK